MKPNRPLIVILSTVALDAVGIGLIMPVLPGLLRDLVHSNDVTAHYGILLALYALMQFACAPVLGALSEFTYTASQPGTHQKIIDMAMNGVGCRATARIMGVGLNTIFRHLKNSGRSR